MTKSRYIELDQLYCIYLLADVTRRTRMWRRYDEHESPEGMFESLKESEEFLALRAQDEENRIFDQ